MFSGIKEKFDDRYGVTVHSEKVLEVQLVSPLPYHHHHLSLSLSSLLTDQITSNHTQSHHSMTFRYIKPWVVTFDNFLTDDEVNALLDTVEGTWERSTDTGTPFLPYLI